MLFILNFCHLKHTLSSLSKKTKIFQNMKKRETFKNSIARYKIKIPRHSGINSPM